jgi:hypothetical protein
MKNILYFFCWSFYATNIKNIFFCRLLKTIGIKNKNIFFMTVEIIS